MVKKTARAARIFKFTALPEIHEFGLRGGDQIIFFHHRNHRLDPIGNNFNILIEQNEIIRRDLRERRIVSGGKAFVTLKANEFQLRPIFTNVISRAVGGIIIGDVNFQIRISGRGDGREKLFEKLLSVPDKDDDGDARQGFFHFVGAA